MLIHTDRDIPPYTVEATKWGIVLRIPIMPGVMIAVLAEERATFSLITVYEVVPERKTGDSISNAMRPTGISVVDLGNITPANRLSQRRAEREAVVKFMEYLSKRTRIGDEDVATIIAQREDYETHISKGTP